MVKERITIMVKSVPMTFEVTQINIIVGEPIFRKEVFEILKTSIPGGYVYEVNNLTHITGTGYLARQWQIWFEEKDPRKKLFIIMEDFQNFKTFTTVALTSISNQKCTKEDFSFIACSFKHTTKVLAYTLDETITSVEFHERME